VFKQAEVQTKNGHWYLMRIMPYRTAENVIDGLVLTFVDINPVKEAQKTMLRMSKVFLNAPDPMLLLDSSGKIVDANEEAVRAYGWSRQEILGQAFHLTVPKDYQQSIKAHLQSCLSGEHLRNVECMRVNKAGQELKESFTLLLLTDEHGQPDAVCMIGKHLST
jgi:two-component system CheB/CheR fusion protein